METEGTLRDFLIFHDFQSWISRERNEIKTRTLFRWNRLAILNRIDLVRIFRVLFRITIRKWPPEKRGISVRLSGRSLVNNESVLPGLWTVQPWCNIKNRFWTDGSRRNNCLPSFLGQCEEEYKMAMDEENLAVIKMGEMAKMPPSTPPAQPSPTCWEIYAIFSHWSLRCLLFSWKEERELQKNWH